MSVPLQKTVFIADAMPFRRARVESFLSPWALNEKVELVSLDPDAARAKLVERAECDMLIYSVGAPPASEIVAEIQVLHMLRREAALAIISDDENSATVIAAIRSGAQGYLGNSMPPDLALQALSFVLHGGTYFPPAAITSSHAFTAAPPLELKPHDGSREQPLTAPEQPSLAPALAQEDVLYERQGALFEQKPAVMHRNGGSPGLRHAADFTERQYAVLVCLCQGDPNKVIGRKLGMTETTVKVHVREIMRKLGVCNRTQVAVAAGRTGVSPDGGVEIISLDSPSVVRASARH